MKARNAFACVSSVAILLLFASFTFNISTNNASANSSTSLPAPTKISSIANASEITESSAYGAVDNLRLKNISIIEGSSSYELVTMDKGAIIQLKTPISECGWYKLPRLKVKLGEAMHDGKGDLIDIIVTLDFPDNLLISNKPWTITDTFNWSMMSFTTGTDTTSLVYAMRIWTEMHKVGESAWENFLTHALRNVRIDIDVECRYAGTNTVYTSDLPALWRWTDLDVATYYYSPDDATHTYYGGYDKPLSDPYFYNESINFIDGVTKTYVQNDCILNVSSDNRTFSSTAKTEGTIAEATSGVIAVANASGFKFRWAGSGCATVFLASANFKSGVHVNRTSSDANFTMPHEGATYGIYRDEMCTDLFMELKVDADGFATTGEKLDIEPGIFYAKEISTTEGYVENPQVYTIDLENAKSQFYQLNVLADPKKYNVTTKVENGTISESATVYYGQEKIVEYAPNEGYSLTSITVDGQEITDEKCSDAYTFSNVVADHDVAVTYSTTPAVVQETPVVKEVEEAQPEQTSETPATKTAEVTWDEPAAETTTKASATTQSSPKTGDEGLLIAIGLIALIISLIGLAIIAKLKSRRSDYTHYPDI